MRRCLPDSAQEHFPITREKVDTEPAQSLIQAPALSAEYLAASQAQLLGHATADSGIVVGLIPLIVL